MPWACEVLSFKVDGIHVTQVRVTTLSVVELLQIGKNMLPSDIPSRVRRPIAPFPLEAGGKRFHDRVIETIPFATHAASHSHALEVGWPSFMDEADQSPVSG